MDMQGHQKQSVVYSASGVVGGGNERYFQGILDFLNLFFNFGGRLKTTKNFITVLGARSSKSRCCLDWELLGGSEGESVPGLSLSSQWLPAILGLPRLVAA